MHVAPGEQPPPPPRNRRRIPRGARRRSRSPTSWPTKGRGSGAVSLALSVSALKVQPCFQSSHCHGDPRSYKARYLGVGHLTSRRAPQVKKQASRPPQERRRRGEAPGAGGASAPRRGRRQARQAGATRSAGEQGLPGVPVSGAAPSHEGPKGRRIQGRGPKS